MSTSRFRTRVGRAIVATGLLLGSTVVGAATVSVLPATQDVFAGDTVTVDLVAMDLLNAPGGSMDVAWDPTVLTMSDVLTGVLIATPPWEDPDSSSFSVRGVLTSGFLSGLRVGTFNFVTGAAPIATLTFTATNTNVPSTTLITVADSAGLGGGWSPAIPPENYNAGTVSVIPIPTDLVDLSGTIKTVDNTDICAMVLASGQFMFSCNPPGVFSLTDLPRENDGTVKRQIYADGFFPKIDSLAGTSSETVVMTRSGA